MRNKLKQMNTKKTVSRIKKIKEKHIQETNNTVLISYKGPWIKVKVPRSDHTRSMLEQFLMELIDDVPQKQTWRFKSISILFNPINRSQCCIHYEHFCDRKGYCAYRINLHSGKLTESIPNEIVQLYGNHYFGTRSIDVPTSIKENVFEFLNRKCPDDLIVNLE